MPCTFNEEVLLSPNSKAIKRGGDKRQGEGLDIYSKSNKWGVGINGGLQNSYIIPIECAIMAQRFFYIDKWGVWNKNVSVLKSSKT